MSLHFSEGNEEYLVRQASLWLGDFRYFLDHPSLPGSEEALQLAHQAEALGPTGQEILTQLERSEGSNHGALIVTMRQALSHLPDVVAELRRHPAAPANQEFLDELQQRLSERSALKELGLTQGRVYEQVFLVQKGRPDYFWATTAAILASVVFVALIVAWSLQARSLPFLAFLALFGAFSGSTFFSFFRRIPEVKVTFAGKSMLVERKFPFKTYVTRYQLGNTAKAVVAHGWSEVAELTVLTDGQEIVIPCGLRKKHKVLLAEQWNKFLSPTE
ncbi:MAG: hypothetical protein MUC92_08655 [Fimbriimonadaceae bacterium]|jgi:hypothetical protein|nr:hypothetical protein [Fimbriimonadaceae bacterium]